MMASRRSVALAAALSLSAPSLSACMVGPNYKRPPPADPPVPEFKETTGPVVGGADNFRPAQPRDAIDRGPWWTMYGDSVLDGVAAQVDISNQTLMQAEAAYRQARALVRQDASALYPTVSGNAGYTQSGSGTGGGRSTQGGIVSSGSGSLSQFTAGPSLNWQADLWGRIRRQIESDSAAAQASAADLANARLSAQANVAINYFSMRISEQRILLFEASVAAFTRSAQIVQNQLDAGIVSRVDLAQAQTQLEQTRAQLVAENINRATFEHAVAVLVGKSPSAFSIEPGPLTDEVPTFDAGVPSALLERRPDIAAAERRAAAANADVGVARAAQFPTLMLDGSAGWQSAGGINLLQAPNTFWMIGPELVGPLFDGGRRRAGVRASRAAFDQASADYRAAVLNAFRDVEDQMALANRLAAEATDQTEAVTAARRSVDLANIRYRQGVATYLDVVTAQTAALTAEQASIQLTTRRLQASVNLTRALGGAWS
jgi:NodT family efflux transporter outer membrane factor (OMF) lipoprotein